MEIGIDIGGTFIKAGIVKDGKVIKFISVPTARKEGYKKVIKNIELTINFLLEDLPKSKQNITKIGAGFPGSFVKENILDKQNKLNLPPKSLFNLLRKYSRNVNIINDANAFVEAQAKSSLGKNKKIVLGITLGTGFGTGLTINQRSYPGKLNAVESRDFPVLYNSMVLKADSILGERGIIRIAKDNGLSVKTARELQDMRTRGSKKVYEIFGRLIGETLYQFIQLFDPELIIIGGGVAHSFDQFSPSMNKILKSKNLVKIPTIRHTKIKHAGIIGAVL